jgi:hypothetical protein
MGCCGKARANLSFSRGAVVPPQTDASRGSHPHGVSEPVLRVAGGAAQPLPLRYIGQSGIVVRGPATGRAYAFSAGTPVQVVDLRDAAVLLRTNYFRQA